MTKKRETWSEQEKNEIIEQVLAAMAEGRTVEAAVQAMQLDLTPGAVRKWMLAEQWAEPYQRAKKMLGHAMAEEAVKIARETTNHSSASDRLLIETLKWAAGKANPAEYGERQTVEHQGAQTLSVKIVEEDVPLRLPARQALESAVLTIGAASDVEIPRE